MGTYGAQDIVQLTDGCRPADDGDGHSQSCEEHVPRLIVSVIEEPKIRLHEHEQRIPPELDMKVARPRIERERGQHVDLFLCRCGEKCEECGQLIHADMPPDAVAGVSLAAVTMALPPAAATDRA